LEEVKMRSSKPYVLFVGLMLVSGIGGVGCAPVFSELQSAKLLGRNHQEFAVNATRSTISNDDDPYGSDYGQTEIGLQFATGVSDRVDLRARYVLVEGVHVVGAGPKVGLLRDRLALFVPIGLGLNASDSLQVHPTLLGTVPLGENAELNGSVKYLIPLSSKGGDKLFAFNVGLGLGPAGWKVRPEFGLLRNPGESGTVAQFSLGLSLYPGR
jgi:hypothetical protein